MSVVDSTTRIVQADTIGTVMQAVPRLLLPDARTLFSQRAKRFEYLAREHALKDWLLFCRDLSLAQQQVLAQVEWPRLSAEHIAEALAQGLPPLNSHTWQADDRSWQAWQHLLHALPVEPTHVARQALVQQLQTWSRTQWETQAHALLQGNEHHVSSEASPFLGAALQVEWVSQASGLPLDLLALYEGESAVCPVCGSHPMVSLIQTGDPTHGVRYLVCALCHTQWHAARAKCTNCDSPKQVILLGESGKAAIQGECCDACHSYVKLLALTRDIHLDACADDLASLALDMQLEHEGYSRAARHLLLTGIP